MGTLVGPVLREANVHQGRLREEVKMVSLVGPVLWEAKVETLVFVTHYDPCLSSKVHQGTDLLEIQAS